MSNHGPAPGSFMACCLLISLVCLSLMNCPDLASFLYLFLGPIDRLYCFFVCSKIPWHVIYVKRQWHLMWVLIIVTFSPHMVCINSATKIRNLPTVPLNLNVKLTNAILKQIIYREKLIRNCPTCFYKLANIMTMDIIPI